MNTLRIFCRGLLAKDYERNNDSKSEEQIAKEKDVRLVGYMTLIMAGLTSFYLKDTIAALKKVYTLHAFASYVLALYLCIAMLSMLLGMVACTFPSSAPAHMGAAGNGALQGLLFVLIGVHLDTFDYHLCPLIGLGVTVLVLIVYWGYSAQDPVITQVIAKLVVWICLWTWWFVVGICNCFWWIIHKMIMFLFSLLFNIFWSLPIKCFGSVKLLKGKVSSKAANANKSNEAQDDSAFIEMPPEDD